MSHCSLSLKLSRAGLPPRRNRGKYAAYRPLVEILEDRALPSISPVHLYSLDGTLADQMGGPALEADGGAFASGRYVFEANQGLRLNGGLADTTNYSIVFVVNMDLNASYFKKLIDFQERTSDDGLYIGGSWLQLYPGDPGNSTLLGGQDIQVVLTRDSASGATLLYLNGVLEQSYFGAASDAAISAANVLTFFADDAASGYFEAAPGSVDYIAIYGRALTAEEIANLSDPAGSPPPIVSADQLAVTVNEGQAAANTGTHSGAVSLIASIGIVTLGADGVWNWTFAAQDGPGQSQTVTITATNAEGVSAATTFGLTVDNVAPEITSLTASNPTASVQSASGLASISGAFADPGMLDTHTVMVSWGDGSAVETLTSIDQINDLFAGQHHYAQAGVFTIHVTVTDNDGGHTTQTTTATVAAGTSAIPGVSLVDHVLYVTGSDGKDIIRIAMFRGRVPGSPRGTPPQSFLRVVTKFDLGSGERASVLYFDPADVHGIVVHANDGNDQVLIDHKVLIDAIVFGGAGRDHIRGGGGNDVLVGGEDHDRLDGGRGSNIVIGGGGDNDHIVPSRKGNDLRILGAVPNQDDLDALYAAIAAWVAGDADGAWSALGLSAI